MNTFLGHIGVVVLIVVSLLIGAAAGFEWPYNVFRAGDKTVAALLGKSGLNTLSAECGAATSGFFFHLRSPIDFVFGADHCRKAAIKEKLV